MLTDGITCHERTKIRLAAYAANHGKHVVKPFMLVVCKDTEHAAWVESYIRSSEFRDGAYRNKTITVHSKQKGAETEANTRLLLGVEDPENPVEIVIHVNMLKEGWDVNNLYTIVPLRTAASKILREQMVGRGLRLPYGERTGDPDVDAVMLTAHDKFQDILDEAQRGDSIFKAGNVIKAEDIPREEFTKAQVSFPLPPSTVREEAYSFTGAPRSEQTDAVLDRAGEIIRNKVSHTIQNAPEHTVTSEEAKRIAESVAAQISEDQDLGETFRENERSLANWMLYYTEQVHIAAKAKFIPIPLIRITDEGAEEYEFLDFELELAPFNNLVPIQNDLLIQNLIDQGERERIKGAAIDFDGYNPQKVILAELRKKPESDYEKCSALLFKLITALCDHYATKHGENGMRNIVMMNKRDLANRIYTQMMRHFYYKNGFLREEVFGTRDYNLQQYYTWEEQVGLFEQFTKDIRQVLFTGIKKGVFSEAKFDSKEGELTLARVLETDPDVINWLRPHPSEFNITYNHGRIYEPDFVVETEKKIYLVEVKGEDKLNDPNVIAKKERGIQYCAAASRWSRAAGYKEWRYLFIPSKQILPTSSFIQLAERFKEL